MAAGADLMDAPPAEPTAPSPGAGTPPDTAPNGGGAPAPPTAAPEWLTSLEGLPDELKGNKTLHRYKSLGDALAALPEQHKRLSEGALKVPGRDAKPEERRAFYDALGVPKDIEGYKDVKFPDGIEGGDAKGLEAYKALALTAGLTPEQVQTSVNFLGEWQQQQRTAMVNGWVERQESELFSKWGANRDRELGIAARGAAHLRAAGVLSEEYTGFLKASGVAEHPDTIKLFHYVGRQYAEEGAVPGHPKGGFSETELQDKIGAIRKDPKHAYNNPGAKGHKEAVAEMESLYKALHPGESSS